MNALIDEDIRITTDRLKSSRSLQDQVNRDIMNFVKQKLAQFDNLSVQGYDMPQQSRYIKKVDG